jgi:hypothetical protein
MAELDPVRYPAPSSTRRRVEHSDRHNRAVQPGSDAVHSDGDRLADLTWST